MESPFLINDNIQISFGLHKDKNVIWISFANNPALNMAAKEIGAKWSQSQKRWYTVDNAHFRALFQLAPLPLAGKDVIAKIDPINLPAFQRFEETIILKGYSKNTLRTYLLEFAQLLYILKDHPVENLSDERLRAYFLYCHKILHLSESHIQSRMNAVKFYFVQVLKKENFFLDIPRPKKPAVLPKVLSIAEINRLFAACENPKHLLILKLCYGMGLRVSEIVALKISDIDTSRLQVLIQSAKGKKDRYVPLPQSIVPQLKQYRKENVPDIYLFEGQYGGQYSIRSVQAVFKNTMRKAKIRKMVGIHGLRHSYATHLHEYGTDITFIQKLLGHNQLATTMVYTQVSQQNIAGVQSPLDRL